jgi:hypothetical protein
MASNKMRVRWNVAKSRCVTAEFDLSFPSNYTIYIPTYPSHIHFTIHNASAIGLHILHWSLNITKAPYWAAKGPHMIIASGMNHPGVINTNLTEAIQLIVEPVSQLVNDTADLLVLRYSSGVKYACEKAGAGLPNPDGTYFV